MTVEEARAWIEARRHEGVHCLCCDQMVREYRRKLNSAMAYALIWLVRRSQSRDDPWVDLRTAPKEVHVSRELAKLAHWELIEEKAVESERGARTSGIWRPTEMGIQFARGKIALPSHVTLYNNVVLEFSSKLTTIRKSLGDHFDFDELWGVPK